MCTSSTRPSVLFEEPGSGAVEAVMDGARVSAVNLSEVIAKLIDRRVPPDTILADLADLDIEIIDFNREQAEIAGLLRGRHAAPGSRSVIARALLSQTMPARRPLRRIERGPISISA